MNPLEKARNYEIENKHIVDPERPVFHFTPPVGWMNDPNGFSSYNKEYHLFFQYYPYDTVWGTMHWGHAKTKDFISWDYLPCALAPDKPYDQNGCFSGGTIELADGRQMIIYSGVTPLNYNIENPVEDLPPESDRYQNQCIAIGDGVDFEKLEANPYLVASTVPEGGSLVDFRDPKLWKEDDTYYMVISNRPASGLGDVLLYRSADALHWEYISTLVSNNGDYGKMWECPDIFHLDGKDVVLVSPMEMVEQGLEYHNGHITMALIGDFDKETGVFHEEVNHAIDYGIDFYSTQSLETYDGRRVMIAWMQNWKEAEVRMEGLHFFGMNTTPRELNVVDGRLIQNPVRELEAYRENQVSYRDVIFGGDSCTDESCDGNLTIPGICGRILDLTLELAPYDDQGYEKFEVQFAKDEQHHLTLQYEPAKNLITVDRSNCGENQKDLDLGRFLVKDQKGQLKLRILLDKYSMEIFANDGEQAATYVFYTDLAADGISFKADGQVKMDITKFDICK
ncbi:MAG: GH32 C-terminal domain-containing protein [Dorea sp.]|nr:GH32 C-terminal domain-containing protein [Dorea sp.]